FFEDT
ncbi:hypothetical protein DMN91_005833, partial [Ooceraea biroi]